MTYVPTAWVDGDCVMAADMNHIEHGVDIAQGDIMVPRGVTAAIPASDPELVGRLYIETDLLQRMWRDNGAGWDLVPTGGGVWAFIAETILGAPAATVTFAAIPGTYRTLVLMAQLRTSQASEEDAVAWRANADAGANYGRSYFYFWGNNSRNSGGALAQTQAYIGTAEGNNSIANAYARMICYWPGYGLADRHKNCMTMANPWGRNPGDASELRAIIEEGWWRSTAAITSLTFFPAVGPNFVAGCHFTLYGIT